jgi:hypothetical protein
MSKPKDSNRARSWSADSGEEGLERITGIDRKVASVYGGSSDPKRFYVAPSHHRSGDKNDSNADQTPSTPDTKKKSATTPSSTSSNASDSYNNFEGEGDHIIAYNLIINYIFALNGENIKELPIKLLDIVKAVAPEAVDLIKNIDHLILEVGAKREVRKNTTASLRATDLEILAQTKPLLIEGEQRYIQNAIKVISGQFADYLNTLPEARISKTRKLKPNIDSKEKRKSKADYIKPKDGGVERYSIDRLLALNEFSTRSDKDEDTQVILSTKMQSGHTMQADIAHFLFEDTSRYDAPILKKVEEFKKGEEEVVDLMLFQVSEFLFDLYDYPKTNKPDQDDHRIDDEQVLFKTIPRLFILAFNSFPKLKDFSKEQKEKIFDRFLNNVLDEEYGGWKDHPVVINDQETFLSRRSHRKSLKLGIAQFSELDFENNIFCMKQKDPIFIFKYSKNRLPASKEEEEMPKSIKFLSKLNQSESPPSTIRKKSSVELDEFSNLGIGGKT